MTPPPSPFDRFSTPGGGDYPFSIFVPPVFYANPLVFDARRPQQRGLGEEGSTLLHFFFDGTRRVLSFFSLFLFRLRGGFTLLGFLFFFNGHVRRVVPFSGSSSTGQGGYYPSSLCFFFNGHVVLFRLPLIRVDFV